MVKLTVEIEATGPESFRDGLGNVFDYLIDIVGTSVIKGSLHTTGCKVKFRFDQDDKDANEDMIEAADRAVSIGISDVTQTLPTPRTESPKTCAFCAKLQTNGWCYDSDAYGASGWQPQGTYNCKNWAEKIQLPEDQAEVSEKPSQPHTT